MVKRALAVLGLMVAFGVGGSAHHGGARAGWTKRTLNPGDKIVVTGTPHKSGQHVLQIRKLIGPSGAELPLFEN